MGALQPSMARYMIDQRRDARTAGQARPSTSMLRSQYNQTFRPQPQVAPTMASPMPPTGGGNFMGDTSVKNLNTIGMAAPTGGMLPAGGGGVAAPGTEGTVNAPLPPGATYKKGGKATVKKMASGGMTSKLSPASSRADGIAQRGKTKCKIC